MNYGTGWKRDTPREYRHTLAAPAPGVLPTTWTKLMTAVGSPTSSMPTRQPVRDQSITSTCVGQALARAMHAYLVAQGIPALFPAVLGIYQMAQLWEQTPPYAPLVDQGCYPFSAISATESWGVVPERDFPFDPAKVNDGLDLDLVQEAALYRVSGWRRIESEGEERVLDIMAHLAAGHPVVFGLDIDDPFRKYVSGVYGRQFANASRGGHMLCVLGYATLMDGSVAFWVVNTWTDRWGEAGWVRIGSKTMGGACVNDVYAITAAPILREAA